MPQYELMYLLGSNVADTDVPGITQQVQKFIADFGGSDIRETQLGKKKLAYPIKKTRNGHYVVVNFAMDGKQINTFDAKIRTMDSSIIRYIMINLDEHLDRQIKDQIVQSKLNRRIPPTEGEEVKESESSTKATSAPAAKKEKPVLVEIDEKALDEKIEAALTEDLTK